MLAMNASHSQEPPTHPAISPDRSHLTTEQSLAASAAMDDLDTTGILRLMNEQDAGLPAVLQRAIPCLSPLVDAVVRSLGQGGRLIYLGAGTSGRLGVLDASECPPTFDTDPGQVVGIIAGGDSALRRSSEGAEDDVDGFRNELERLAVNERDTVVGIAAGGTTPYVLGGLRLAGGRGATTGLICCVAESVVRDDLQARGWELPNHLVSLPVGPEVVTGSTRLKAGTATKMALNMLTTAAMVRLGKVWGNWMVDLRASNAKLRDRAVRILQRQCDLSRAQAIELLTQAQGRVKLALVMHHKQLDAQAARQLLDQHQGRLRPILGNPR